MRWLRHFRRRERVVVYAACIAVVEDHLNGFVTDHRERRLLWLREFATVALFFVKLGSSWRC